MYAKKHAKTLHHFTCISTHLQNSDFMIPLFSNETINFPTFFFDFALRNEACILDESFTSDWKSVGEWRDCNGVANLSLLFKKFGDAEVPVLTNEDQEYLEVKFSEFVTNFVKSNREKCGYLKDWHFQSEFPLENAYNLPSFLKLDWINNESWTSAKANPFGGDYRFLYFGIKGSWTKFHCDVLETFSWSANICGRKLWYILRPGMEKYFKLSRDCYMEDIRERPDLWAEAGVIEIIQEAGQIFFIPTSWYHQVHNLEDTISINHNVINSSNIDLLVGFLTERLLIIGEEISDVKGVYSTKEFQEKCEEILLADCRINSLRMLDWMNLIIEGRCKSIKDYSPLWKCQTHSNIFDCKRNSNCQSRMRSFVEANCHCKSINFLCENCANFVNSFDLLCAKNVLSLKFFNEENK